MKYARKTITFKSASSTVYVDTEEMNFGKDLTLKRLKYSLSAADYLFSYGKNKNIPLRVGKS